MKAKTITAGQIKKIHSLTGALSIDDDVYRTMLLNRFKVDTCKALSSHSAGAFIEELESMALASGVWKKQPGKAQRHNNLQGRTGMASPAQLRKIEAMWAENSRVADSEGRKKALRSFIERIAKVSDLRFLNSEGAVQVLTALGAIDRKRQSVPSKKAV